jgi:hypothetical protein
MEQSAIECQVVEYCSRAYACLYVAIRTCSSSSITTARIRFTEYYWHHLSVTLVWCPETARKQLPAYIYKIEAHPY